jgi:hypothetical protein
MSNYAALIDVLSVAGSRLSDGSPNASGTVYFMRPGTNTPVNAYSDAAATTVITQPVTLGAGGLLNTTTFPNGIFVTQPVRMLVQDVSGNTVVDTTYIPATAGDVGVSNAGFTDSTLDAVLTKAFTSTGGQDWKYLESAGATSRTLKDKLKDGGISVKDFGAVGDGVAVDTTAIQAAFNEAKALSCNVLFPAGVYKIDQAITLSSAVGVQVIGAGRGAVLIKPTHATANAFTFTACTDSGIHSLSILHTTGSTGAGVAVGGASPNFKMTHLCIPANATYVGFAYSIDFSGASDFDIIAYCTAIGSTRTARFNCTSSSKPGVLLGNSFGAGGLAPVPSTVAVEFNGSNGGYTLLGNFFAGNTSAILYNAAFTGTKVRYFGNQFFSTGTVTIDVSGLSADRDILRLEGNDINGYTVNVTTGATVTPDRSKGRHIRIRGTTTGSAYVVAAPTPAPSLGDTRDLDLYITFYNNAGGAVTGWTMNAAYRTSAGPSTVNLEMTSYHFKWDADVSVWREFARSVTT